MRSVPIPFLERFVGQIAKPPIPEPETRPAEPPPVISDTPAPPAFIPEIWGRGLVERYYRQSMLERAIPDNTPWFGIERPNFLDIRMFYERLFDYPVGSVAHSIGRIEVAREEWSDSQFMRGISYSKYPSHQKYFSFQYDQEEFRRNKETRNHLVMDVITMLEAAWRDAGIEYWDTPIRRM